MLARKWQAAAPSRRSTGDLPRLNPVGTRADLAAERLRQRRPLTLDPFRAPWQSRSDRVSWRIDYWDGVVRQATGAVRCQGQTLPAGENHDWPAGGQGARQRRPPDVDKAPDGAAARDGAS